MTFKECTDLEPRLSELARKAINTGKRVNWREWETIKWQLKRLVGMYAEREELGTSEAYDTAYQMLWIIYRGTSE